MYMAETRKQRGFVNPLGEGALRLKEERDNV